MHGYKDQRRYVGGCGPGCSASATNIVVLGGRSYRGYGLGCGYGGRKHGRRHADTHDRPPKLTRFYGSCGLLDRDIAARMSDGELCSETFAVASHSARQIGNVACDMGHKTVGFVGAVAQCACCACRLVYTLIKSI